MVGWTYSDLETLIGEDEGGVGGGELGVRHCWMESGGELPRSLQERTNKGFYSENLLVVGRRRSSKIRRTAAVACQIRIRWEHAEAGATSLADARVRLRLQLRLQVAIHICHPQSILQSSSLLFRSPVWSLAVCCVMLDLPCSAIDRIRRSRPELSSHTHHIRCSCDSVLE